MLISDKLVSWVCIMQVAFNWMELPRLTEEELDLCRKAFQHFDKDGAECSAKQTRAQLSRYIGPSKLQMLVLMQDNISGRHALAGSGTIDVKELRTALAALGQNPTDEELFVMISQVS